MLGGLKEVGGRSPFIMNPSLSLGSQNLNQPFLPAFSNKILTSAKNGELVMWDVNRGAWGSSKVGELP